MTSQILPSKALLADFDIIRLSKNQQCMYPGCPEEPIRSHTISKSSIRQLNTDTIQLKTINDNLFDRIKHDDKRNVFNECRISNVSTFYGFCKQHDASLFKPIDQFDGTVTNKIALLSHYRIVCFGLDQIRIQLEQEKLLRVSEYAGPGSKKINEFLRKLKKGYFKKGLETIQESYNVRKKICESIITNKHFNKISCVAFDGSPNNPLVSGRCGTYFHHHNRKLPSKFLLRMPYITYTTLHNGKNTTLLFCLLDLDNDYYEDLVTFIDPNALNIRLERLFFGHSDFCILNEPLSGSIAEKAIKEIICTDRRVL